MVERGSRTGIESVLEVKMEDEVGDPGSVIVVEEFEDERRLSLFIGGKWGWRNGCDCSGFGSETPMIELLSTLYTITMSQHYSIRSGIR